MTRNAFLRKIQELRYKYGDHEASYFQKNPRCETCGEARIAALTVHHTHGRKHNKVVVLCFNCHMVVHHGSFTHADHLVLEQKNNVVKSLKAQKDLEIAQKYLEIKSLRAVGRFFNISYGSVKNSVKRVRNRTTFP